MGVHPGTVCGAETCDAYFIDGLSHWLGMDVHDVGDYSTPLKAGMVLTIEPGIYLAQESLGVRIEDDVLVTATGAEWLSAKAPRTTAEIQRLMGRAQVSSFSPFISARTCLASFLYSWSSTSA